MTTNDDHQAHIPTALTSKNQATNISGKTRARRHPPARERGALTM
jgi:hypothetical protein